MAKRVLIVNKFYYSRGGDCVCTLNLEKLLIDNGFQVMVYAMQYHKNLPSKHSKYFAKEVNFLGGISDKFNAIKRTLGIGNIKKSFKHVLEEFKPDVVHIQNIHSYISPVVVKMAKEYGCRVVWTLHDYKLLCPSYSCLNKGKPCELCFNDKRNVLKQKCMKGSVMASVLAYVEALKWNITRIEKYTDAFVCPSMFMKTKMELGGFNAHKLHKICNFIDPHKAEILNNIDCTHKEDCYVYVGRLSEEKGVRTLLKVATTLPYTLKIAGGGPLLDELKAEYSKYANIQFLGHLSAEDISLLMAKAKFLVVPSECYENNPLSVIESLYAGTPVLGANIGGIPELVNANNGLIFEPGNVIDLEDGIKRAFNINWNTMDIKAQALINFSSEKYYNNIMNCYFPFDVKM
ncbi:MAG: glycosyltransferase [Muribaculaceae bacterium]